MIPLKIILISHPEKCTDYRLVSQDVLRNIGAFHIRKPSWSREAVRSYADDMPLFLKKKSVFHDHFDLSEGFRGIHLNRARFQSLKRFGLGFSDPAWMSASLGSLQDLYHPALRCLQYFFISPVFSSISKADYHPPWSHQILRDALLQSPYAQRAVALGGITAQGVERCRDLGFVRVAVLGFVWGSSDPNGQLERLLDRL